MDSAAHKLNPKSSALLWLTAIILSLIFIFLFSSLNQFLALAILVGLPIVLTGFVLFVKEAITNRYLIFLPAVMGIYFGELGNLFPEGAIPFSVFQIGFILGVGMFIISLLVTQDLAITTIRLELEFLILFGIMFISVIYSPNYDESLFYSLRSLLQIVFLYLLFNTLSQTSHLKTFFIIITICAVIVGLIGIIQYINDPKAAVQSLLSHGVKNRSSGTVDDPNVFATHFYLPLSFSLALYYESKKLKHKIVAVLLFLFFIVTIASTFSRTAFIAVTLIVSVFIIRYKNYALLLYGIVGAVIVFVFSPTARIEFMNLFGRVMSIFEIGKDDSTGIRFVLLEGSLIFFFKSWFMGIGVRAFSVYFEREYGIFETIGVLEPHNLFYTAYSELGIIGFLVFMIIMGTIIYRAYYCFKHAKTKHETIFGNALFTSMLGLMVFHNSYGGGFTHSQLWMQAALIFVLHRIVFLRESSGLTKESLNDR